MSKILRAFQKIFAGSLPAAGNIPQFGSLANGNPNFSTDPAVIQGLARYLQGWNGGVVANHSPTLQDMQALFFLITRQLAYSYQAGLPEWEANTTYFVGDWARVGKFAFTSKTDNNTGNPVTDTNNWEPLAASIAPTFNPAGLCKAWVFFDGGPAAGGAIRASYNVSSVTRNSVGTYTINFDVPLSGDDYSWAGTVGCQNGGSTGAGNNNHLIGGGLQVAAQLRVISYEPTGGPIGPEDSDRVSVMVFAP